MTEDKCLDMLQEAADELGWDCHPVVGEDGTLHGIHMGDETFQGSIPESAELDWDVEEQTVGGQVVGLAVVRTDGEICHATFFPY